MTQLTLNAQLGSSLKVEGLAEIEQTDQPFVDRMRVEAIKISQQSGFVTSDNLRVFAASLGLVPKHQNSWGAVFKGAKWKVVGRQKSAVPGNHSREIRVWQYIER